MRSSLVPLSAPVIAATRLRGGNAASARGAVSRVSRAVATARDAGCAGLVIARGDSAYYTGEVVAAVRRGGARFSLTVPSNSKVTAAISAVPEDAWTAIRYPRALWDDQLGCWVSEAEVTETQYTAFEHDPERAVTARLIVRRVRDQDKAPRVRGSCSPPGATTPCSPTPRTSSSRPKASTATTRSSSRSSPTSTTGRWPTCRRGSSPRTPPGCRSRHGT